MTILDTVHALEKVLLPSGGVLLPLAIIFLYPEKVEQWSVILWKLINKVSGAGEKKIVAHGIQGSVNWFSRRLSDQFPNFEPVGIKIEWVTRGETPSEFFRDNRLVIRMRQHDDQAKNFVNASMVLISRAFLTKAKKYLSPSQKESIDLFVARKLYRKEGSAVESRFYEDFFGPKALSSEKIRDLLDKYEIIDRAGLFFPVLVQELTFLGEKVFYKPRSDRIISEMTDLVYFLKVYAQREIGDQTTPTLFTGAYCRCGIVIIAKQVKREAGDTTPYLRFLKKHLANGVETLYLLGSASPENRAFIDRICAVAERDLAVHKYAVKEYEAWIKFAGRRQRVDNYMVVLRAAHIEHYYGSEAQETIECADISLDSE